MKNLYSMILAAVITFSAGGANAGIPVIDAATQINLGLQYAKQIVQYTTQLNELTELVNTVTQLTNTYNAITGNRGLGTLLNGAPDQAARRYLPGAYSDVSALSGAAVVPGYGSLQSLVTSLKAGITTIPTGTFTVGSIEQDLLDSKVNTLATQKALGQSSYDSVLARFANIENLIATSATATDPKAIAELQARIGAEQALAQNETAKLQAMAYMQQVEKQQAEQKAQDLVVKQATKVPALIPY